MYAPHSADILQCERLHRESRQRRCALRLGCAYLCTEKSLPDRKVPGFDSVPSSDAVALPEGSNLFVGRNATPQRFVQRGSLVIAQNIDTCPARFNFTRHFGEFVLIFLRPMLNPAQNLFGSLGHDINIPNRSFSCQSGSFKRFLHIGATDHCAFLTARRGPWSVTPR